ncbi:MAG: segregation/condensation protein A [Candidatus Brocadiia bacterium]
MTEAEQSSAPAELSLQDFRAELDVFSGPLDLLLHLIKQEEVDVFEVPVSRVTDRYLAAVRAMELFDVNVAAEFLVVAATLMEIKSRTLLPPAETDEEEEEDPGVELVRRLLEYKKYKEAAGELEERARRRAARAARPRPEPEAEEADTPEVLLEELAVWDLMTAFSEVVEQTQLKRPTHVVRSHVPVSAYVEEVLERLRSGGGSARFIEFFSGGPSRERVVGMFLALLELVRRRRISVEQPGDDAVEMVIRVRAG